MGVDAIYTVFILYESFYNNEQPNSFGKNFRKKTQYGLWYTFCIISVQHDNLWFWIGGLQFLRAKGEKILKKKFAQNL